MKIKIVSIVSTLERSGPTSMLYNLIRNLDERFIAHVVSLSPESKKSRWNDFAALGIELKCLGLNRLNWLLHGAATIKKEMEKLTPHIIHTHSLRPDMLSARHLNKWKRVSTIHGNLEAAYSDTYGRHLGKRFATRQINAIKSLERKVACSESVYELYRNEFSELSCIPNGVDTTMFKPVNNEEKLLQRTKLQLPTDRTLFISAGALTALKDPLTVIEGFRKSNTSKKSTLIILGHGPLEKQVKALHDNDQILFRGFESNVAAYYTAADFFISASHSEGLPNSVLEAMSCGLPVCLSHIDAHRNILGDSMAGFLFEKKNPEQLAKYIDRLLDQNYAQLRKSALDLIDKNFTAETMTRHYQNLYLDLIAKS